MSELVFNVHQEEDGGYWTEAQGLPLITQGSTWQELCANVVEVVDVYYGGLNLPKPAKCVSIWSIARNCLSPKLPRDVDGALLARVLCARFGYTVRNQVGSHVLLERDSATHLAIPAHKAVRVGTLASILRNFEEQTGASRDDLLKLL